MLPYHRKLLSAGGGGYRAKAVTFDGTNDYMTRNSSLVGSTNPNARQCVFSCWLKKSVDATMWLYSQKQGSSENCIRINNTLKTIEFIFENGSSGLTAFSMVGDNNTLEASDGWVNVLAAWDATYDDFHIYINDADVFSSRTNFNREAILTSSPVVIGADAPSAAKFNGDIADYYFNQGEYLDLSVEANRRKFISATGKPVFLGADGSLPTGTAPIIFMSQQNDDAPSDFGANKGTGGDFTITGALTSSPTSPSD